ncbi:beta strand repeat-containing protein, partial [Marinospirillum alkaliphilum]
TLAAGSGTAAFGGVIGGTTALTSLAVTAGNITLGGNVTTTGAQTYTGPMTLTGGTGVTRSLNAGAGQITLGSVNATGESLTLQGNAILNGALTGLSELDISGTTTLNTGSITTTGNQSYNGTLTLTEATSLTSTGGDISFNGIAGATQNLTTEASSGTTFFTGDILALGVLDVTGAASLGGSITTSGSQTYQGVVTLTDATSLTTTNQNIDFQSGIQGDYALTLNTGSADILISGTSNLYSLTLTQARHVTLQDIALNEAFLQVAGTGTTAFNGDLSASTLELTTQSMQLAANKTLNSTAGNITVYSDGLLIGADASLNAGSGTVTLAPQTQTNTLQVCSTTSCSGSGFDSTYDLGTLSITAGTITVGRTSHTGNITLQSIAYGYNLTLENAAAGYIRVAGTVEGSGGFLNLNSNGGSIQLGGSITTTGNQTYSGNLSLTDTTNLNSTAGNISLNSISGGGYNLTTTTAAGFNSLFTGTTA